MHNPEPDKKKGQSDPNQPGGKAEECKVRGEIHVRGEIEVNPPPSSVKEHKTEREEDNAKDKKNFVVSVATLAAVIVYAFLTFWQGCTSRESLNSTKDFFQRDQRPYVFSDHVDAAQIDPFRRLATHIYYTNYGKSPALHVKRTSEIFSGPDMDKQVDDWFKGLPNWFEEPTNLIASQWALGDGPIMQGMKPTCIIGSHTVVGSENVPYMVVMRIQYSDAFNGHYWSDICWWHPFPDTAISYCIKHNDIY